MPVVFVIHTSPRKALYIVHVWGLCVYVSVCKLTCVLVCYQQRGRKENGKQILWETLPNGAGSYPVKVWSSKGVVVNIGIFPLPYRSPSVWLSPASYEHVASQQGKDWRSAHQTENPFSSAPGETTACWKGFSFMSLFLFVHPFLCLCWLCDMIKPEPLASQKEDWSHGLPAGPGFPAAYLPTQPTKLCGASRVTVRPAHVVRHVQTWFGLIQSNY